MMTDLKSHNFLSMLIVDSKARCMGTHQALFISTSKTNASPVFQKDSLYVICKVRKMVIS